MFSDFIILVINIHSHKTRYATQGNLYITNIRTDYGKYMFRYKAVQVWESVPSHLKSLTEPAFRKQYKTFLHSNQQLVDVTECPLFIVRGRVNERPG